MNYSLEHKKRWKNHVMIYIAILSTIFFFYFDVLSSLIEVWIHSPSYQHGSLVIIISFFLIFWKRKEIYPITPQIEILAIVAIFFAVLLGVLAKQVDVLIVQQYVLILLIQLSFLLVFGRKISAQVLFPLIYMYFAVPVGESLFQPMVDWTAYFIITSIELIGIPIYSTGNVFSLPTSDWSVVEACSGTRYLFASITLGALYAYLTYSNYYKRTIFIVISAILPIFSNWLRALSIVLIAHYNDMALAKGIDHFLFGWVFFGIVMFILFWLGSFWADTKHKLEPVTEVIESQAGSYKNVLISLISILIILLGAMSNHYLNGRESYNLLTNKIEISEADGWKISDKSRMNWKYEYFNPLLEYQNEFIKDNKTVGVYIAYYIGQRNDSELINSKNIMSYVDNPIWHKLEETSFLINLAGSAEKVIKMRLTSEQQEIVLFRWNNISGKIVTSDPMGKLLELFDKLIGKTRGEYAIVLYTSKTYSGNEEKLIQDFVDDMYQPITDSLDNLVDTLD